MIFRPLVNEIRSSSSPTAHVAAAESGGLSQGNANEPAMDTSGGFSPDGLDHPPHSGGRSRHLNKGGGLLCEIGTGAKSSNANIRN